jgi:hypothetical protein
MRGNWPIDEIGQGHEKRDIRATAPPQLELGVACHHSFHHHHYLLLYLLFIKPNHLMIAHIVLWRVRWCRDEKASDEDKRDKWKSRASRRWSKDPTLWLVNYQAPFLASNILSQERWSKNPHSTRCVKTTWSNQSFATKFRVRKELFKTSKVVVKGPGNHCIAGFVLEDHVREYTCKYRAIHTLSRCTTVAACFDPSTSPLPSSLP